MPDSQEAIDAAWRDEAARRAEELEREGETVDGEEAVRAIRRELQRSR